MATSQRSIVRLTVLAGLLLLYPAAALLLHGVTPLASEERPSEDLAQITATWISEGAEGGLMQVAIRNRSALPVQIASVTAQLVQRDDTLWSETWEGAFFAGSAARIAPSSTWNWDVRAPQVTPRPGVTLLVTVEVRTGVTGPVHVLQAGLDLGDPSHPLPER